MAVSKPVPDMLTMTPTIPEPATVDWTHARISYDRINDELSVSFGGVAVAAASIPLDIGDRDFIYARVNPTTGETVGLQIDGFLAYAVTQYPNLVAFLVLAELHGYDDLAAADLRRWARERTDDRAEAGMSAAVGQLIA